MSEHTGMRTVDGRLINIRRFGGRWGCDIVRVLGSPRTSATADGRFRLLHDNAKFYISLSF